MNKYNFIARLYLMAVLISAPSLTLSLAWFLDANLITVTRADASAYVLAAPVPETHSPPANALNVPLTTSLSITFDQAISLTTVTSRTLVVYGSQSPIYTGAYDLSNSLRTVNLNPVRRFFPGEQIHTTVTTGTTSITGERVISATVWQFWTAVTPSTAIFTDSGQTFSQYLSHAVASGDVDNDGDLDAFFGCQLWKNNGNGFMTYQQDTSGCEAMVLGDLDGDGDLDALIARFDYRGGEDNANQVWFNDGHGNFTDSGQQLGNRDSWDVALGDLDGDGDLDAFIANGTSGVAGVPNEVWINNGTGFFNSSSQDLGNLDSRFVQLGDLDNDGDLDAFVANHFGEGNQVWLNDGNGNFSSSGQSLGKSTNDDSVSVALGDIDGDGDLDALVGNNASQPDKLWINDGSGHFSFNGQTVGGTADTEAVVLGDLDGDGDLDAFIGINGCFGGSLGNQIWLNDGTGGFSDSGQRLGNLHTDRLAVGDMDGDGDLDVLFGNGPGVDPKRIWLNDTVWYRVYLPLVARNLTPTP